MLPGRAGRVAGRSFLAMERTPEAMFLDNFAAVRLSDQGTLLQSPRAAASRGRRLRFFDGLVQPAAGGSSLLPVCSMRT